MKTLLQLVCRHEEADSGIHTLLHTWQVSAG